MRSLIFRIQRAAIARRSIPTLLVVVMFTSCAKNDKNVIEASGTIEGTEVNVSAEVAGRVLKVGVDEGASVATGDTLVVIDNTEYELQLRQAVANEEAFASQYRLTVAGARKEDIIQAEATFRNAEADFERMKGLLASHTITQKQYDDALARYVAAQQGYEKLLHGARQDEIIAARVRREQAAAQADLLRKKMRDCVVRAPSAGIVTLRAVEPGELVTMGTNLIRLTYLAKVKLTIYVSEGDLGSVRLGQPVDVITDMPGRNEPFRGKVTYVSPVAEFTPKNVQTREERTKLVFAVRVEIGNPDRVLKPGMPADARIAVQQPPQQASQ